MQLGSKAKSCNLWSFFKHFSTQPRLELLHHETWFFDRNILCGLNSFNDHSNIWCSTFNWARYNQVRYLVFIIRFADKKSWYNIYYFYLNVGKELGKSNKICNGKPFGSPCKFIAGVDPPTGYCDNGICIFIPKEAENLGNLQLIKMIYVLPISINNNIFCF